jgi:hypothetical protein
VLKTGLISIDQRTSLGPPDSYNGSANALFLESSSAVNPSCAVTTSGPCTATVCTTSGAGGGDAGALTYPSAGTITITTPMGPGFTLSPGADGSYTFTTRQGQLWTAGGSVAVSAAGAAVPAFSGAVSAPPDITLTAPVFGANTYVTISRATDLAVTWTGGGAGNVRITFGTTHTGSFTGVQCVVPQGPGAAAIPAAVLGKLAKADGATILGSFAVVPLNDTNLKAGDFDVILRATGTSVSGGFRASD